MSATDSTLDLVRQIMSKANNPAELQKSNPYNPSWTIPGSATTGLQSYDLEGPAKNLYPVLTPIRNRLPRVSGKGGSQANWKAVTALNVGQQYAGVAEGRRGQMISHSVADYNAVYRTIGLESAVTFEAELSAEGYDDLRARAATMLLQSMMVEEEQLILGGNTSVALGTTPTPSLATTTTGGSIAASTTVSVICIAMSYDAFRRNNSATLPTALTPTTTITPTDGAGTLTVGAGFAQKSTNTTLATGAGTATNAITATVASVAGAYGYAWFWGTAGSETLGAITSTSQVVITTAAGTGTPTATAFTSDNSTSSLVFDGLLSIVAKSGMNGYRYAATPGSGLTGDGSSGIVEFDVLLQHMWDVWRLQPSRMMVSSQEMLNIRKRILASGGSQNAVRFAFDVGPGQTIVGGSKPRGYLSPFQMTGQPSEIPIEMHPNMPPGTILFETDVLPYAVNNVSNIAQIKCRRDYYQTEWPLRTRMYEYGVYSDQVLQHYAPFSMGVITNLANV